jgi:hypothetical protein
LVALALSFATSSIATASVKTRSGNALSAFDHGGGLDRNGCHHDRQRGGYHCH